MDFSEYTEVIVISDTSPVIWQDPYKITFLLLLFFKIQQPVARQNGHQHHCQTGRIAISTAIDETQQYQ